MNRKIFFDLDGTLIDTSERQYRVYNDILGLLRLSNKLSKEEFWNLKRAGKKTLTLLPDNAVKSHGAEFSKKWLEKVEEKEYLNYDKLYPKSVDVLSALECKFDLLLVTLRRNKKNLLWELDNLCLTKYFKLVINGSPLLCNDKVSLIQGYTKSHAEEENGIIIGDSEMDVITGKKLGMLSIGITYGIRSRSFLRRLRPSFLIDSLPEILNILDDAGPFSSAFKPV